MQCANIMLSLAGDVGNTIPKFGVTPAEIVLLQAIHGPEAVHDVEPLETEIDRSPREELGRLRQEYASATDSNLNRIVDKVFPGAAARVPTSLDDNDLSDQHMKPTARASVPKAKTVAKTGSGRTTAARRDEEAGTGESGVLG